MYWCAVPTERLPEVVRTRCDLYWQALNNRGIVDLWRRTERTYYGLDEHGAWKESAAVTFSGDSDEELIIRVNHFRSLLQTVLAMSGVDRPAFSARAKNDKTESLAEAPLATGVIQAFWKDWDLERKTSEDDEIALIYGTAFMHLRWDPFAGKKAPSPENPNRKEGDVVPEACPPWRVVHELGKQGSLEWAIVAHEESAWSLAARYPRFAEQLIGMRGGSENWPKDIWVEPWQSNQDDEDTLTVWCVYHRPSDVMPQGRYAIVCGSVVLYDGPGILEDQIPVLAMVPSKQIGRGTGYTAAWDLLPIQEAYDLAESANLSVVEGFAGQHIIAPKDSGVAPEDLAGTRGFIQYEPRADLPAGGAPQPLDTRSPRADIFEFSDRKKQEMQLIIGVNSVARGEPDASLKSGAALALVQSQAVQFNSGFQAARIMHREDIASTGYKLVRKTMVSPRMARRPGAGSTEYLQTVTRDQLEDIQGVEIELASPLLRQAAGRMEIGDKLLDRGLITTPEQYLRILTAGTVEPLLKSQSAELDQISAENDHLSKGMPLGPPPVPSPQGPQAPMMPGFGVESTDTHEIHVREHRALLDMQTRANPQVAQVIRQHIAEHYRVWSSTPPDMAALMGWKVMPPPPIPPPGAMGPPPDAPPPSGEGPDSPPPPSGGSKEPPAERVGALGGPPPPGAPMMPIEPLSGKRMPNPRTTA